MTEIEQNGAYIVSWDFSRGGDVGVLIVGRQKAGKARKRMIFTRG